MRCEINQIDNYLTYENDSEQIHFYIFISMSVRYCLLAVLIFTLNACTHSISKFYPEIIPKKSDVTFPIVPDGDQEINIVYLGAGNLVLEHNGEAIITDPFFSNQRLLKLLGRINTKPQLYATWKTNYEYFLSPAVVKAGLVSHTHYDHAMDLPILLEKKYFTNMNVVYGNSYLPKILENFDNEGANLVALTNKQVFDPTDSPDDSYEWISVTPRIRFLPILSNHAPHTKKKLYMDKPLDAAYFDEHLIYSNSKTKAFKWSTGSTYSFLVDFITTDTLRVFIQTSASLHPYGFPPETELMNKKVDLAILCYASAPNVDNYPNALIEAIQPKKLMWVHWEDFFRTPKSFDDQRLVRSTKPRKVRERIDRLGKPNSYFIMPKPGTRIKVKY